MAGSRFPGPLGSSSQGPLPNNSGTLSRSASSLPGSIGLHFSHQPTEKSIVTGKNGLQTGSVYEEIEQILLHQYSLAHNRADLKLKGLTPRSATKKKMNEIESGLASVVREDFTGPHVFLRVVGSRNRAYSGEWWFDASLLDSLDRSYSRVFFNAPDKKKALRDMLRELLAVSTEWNTISEVWVMELPSGESIRGYSGRRC